MFKLSSFHSIRPPHKTLQEDSFHWIVEAHTQSERFKGMKEDELLSFKEALKEKLWKVGCKPGIIQERGHILPDFGFGQNWDDMLVYRLLETATGEDLSVRFKYFEEFVDEAFRSYYADCMIPPSDLIHVSCTGYVSPSGAQKVVSEKNWGTQTTVTHAYHMGCYAAFPAGRIGQGFLKNGSRSVDIVHTEISTIHFNPSRHEMDQLVAQSLFADGCIKYTLSLETSLPHFSSSLIHEEILPHSKESMTWKAGSYGFEMFLAKEIPVHIKRGLKEYLVRLCKKNGHPVSILDNALYAIHPGGPKILEYIQDLLQLKQEQMNHSLQIFKQCGNMSSATLPHVWEAILNDRGISQGTTIISLAFGPGLTIAGSIMVKQ